MNDELKAEIDLMLEAHVKETVEQYKPMQMRQWAMQIASGSYRNSDGDLRDKTASGMISFADQIFNYIMEGKK